jgi:hypothetical protein
MHETLWLGGWVHPKMMVGLESDVAAGEPWRSLRRTVSVWAISPHYPVWAVVAYGIVLESLGAGRHRRCGCLQSAHASAPSYPEMVTIVPQRGAVSEVRLMDRTNVMSDLNRHEQPRGFLSTADRAVCDCWE